jgi:predicted DNA-binding protein (UPF0251 family)
VKSSDVKEAVESSFRKRNERAEKRTDDRKRKNVHAERSCEPKASERTKASQLPKNAGRPSCLDRETHENLLRAYYTHPYSFRELADMFGVSRMTVWRAVQEAPVAEGFR